MTKPSAKADGEMAFVDAHHHFQDIERHYYPWLVDRDAPPKLEGYLGPIRRNYLVSDYLADLVPARVVKSVHIQNGWDPRDPVGETRWLQNLAATTGFPTAIVTYADLSASDVEAVLERHAAHPSVRGVRDILNWDDNPLYRVAARPDLMSDTAWRRSFHLLGRFGLSFDMQIYWQQMDEAFRLATDYLDTIIVLDHFGMPVDRSLEGVRNWRADMTRLARAPNVLVKLSGLGLGHPRWTIEDTMPLLKTTIDIFGVERCMIGTNLPVDRLFAPPSTILDAYRMPAAGLSEADRDAMFRKTAERAYRI